ncbi:hypothetical protein Poly41_50480 [Novipirellula artificiosorum]|uniref:Uncharacterized protein n=1 Tax=Novipirellula artificiosorum TaxID=2528016 RepID=A0A5C6DDK2_9BACT|nr:hypothetical protein Poly41_50480 [Novipirellula artificiosorum]
MTEKASVKRRKDHRRTFRWRHRGNASKANRSEGIVRMQPAYQLPPWSCPMKPCGRGTSTKCASNSCTKAHFPRRDNRILPSAGGSSPAHQSGTDLRTNCAVTDAARILWGEDLPLTSLYRHWMDLRRLGNRGTRAATQGRYDRASALSCIHSPLAGRQRRVNAAVMPFFISGTRQSFDRNKRSGREFHRHGRQDDFNEFRLAYSCRAGDRASR